MHIQLKLSQTVWNFVSDSMSRQIFRSMSQMLSRNPTIELDPRAQSMAKAPSTDRILPSAPPVAGGSTPPSGTPIASGKSHHHSSKTRERHKTMLVRQTASFFKAAAPPPKEEEAKPAEPVKPVFDTKRAVMMNAIITWSRNLSRSKLLIISQAFNKWKYMGLSTTSTGTVEGEVKKEKIGEQKNSYLLLFKENEKLREQLNDSRRSALLNEKTMRNTAMVSMLKIILRSRLTAKQRYYYDIWLNNTKMMQLIGATNQRSLQLEVGLQQIDSERNYVQKTEALNTKLKCTLGMAVCFFNWKGKAAQTTLHEERSMYEKQRKLIFNELIRIRKVVSAANKQEVAVMHNALSRGEELSHNLDALKDQLARAAKLGKSTTSGLSAASVATAEDSTQGNSSSYNNSASDTASVVTTATSKRSKGDSSRHSSSNNTN